MYESEAGSGSVHDGEMQTLMNLDNLIAIDQLVGYPQRDLAFDLSAPGGCIRGFSITSHTVGMTDGCTTRPP